MYNVFMCKNQSISHVGQKFNVIMKLQVQYRKGKSQTENVKQFQHKTNYNKESWLWLMIFSFLFSMRRPDCPSYTAKENYSKKTYFLIKKSKQKNTRCAHGEKVFLGPRNFLFDRRKKKQQKFPEPKKIFASFPFGFLPEKQSK